MGPIVALFQLLNCSLLLEDLFWRIIIVKHLEANKNYKPVLNFDTSLFDTFVIYNCAPFDSLQHLSFNVATFPTEKNKKTLQFRIGNPHKKHWTSSRNSFKIKVVILARRFEKGHNWESIYGGFDQTDTPVPCPLRISEYSQKIFIAVND